MWNLRILLAINHRMCTASLSHWPLKKIRWITRLWKRRQSNCSSIAGRGKNSFLFDTVPQTRCRAQPSFIQQVQENFPHGKEGVQWLGPPTSIHGRGYESVELHLHPPPHFFISWWLRPGKTIYMMSLSRHSYINLYSALFWQMLRSKGYVTCEGYKDIAGFTVLKWHVSAIEMMTVVEYRTQIPCRPPLCVCEKVKIL
jgi:hypothetical protein